MIGTKQKGSRKSKNSHALNLQYQYDSMGEKIGVFIPIGDWHILTQKFDNIAIPTYPSMVKEKYKKGLLKSLKEVDTDIKSKVKLQSANDFIKEMRAAAK